MAAASSDVPLPAPAPVRTPRLALRAGDVLHLDPDNLIRQAAHW